MAEEYTEEGELAELAAKLRRRLVRGEIREGIDRVILAPAAELLGPAAAKVLSGSADRRADELTDQLIGPDRLAAADAARVLWVLVPRGNASWWRSSLGQALAGASETAPSETVTQAEAARYLGVTRGRVAQLVKAGQLRTSTDGKPLLASVLDRLAGVQ